MMTECECVRCGDCGGSGQVFSPTEGYPEFDLESCGMCGGTGIVEMCGHCTELEELQESREFDTEQRELKRMRGL
jgi:hypothetical protein